VSALLVADSIGKAFGRKAVLRSARLEARAGSVTVVAGRNGAGKSTLLRIAAGWLRPDHGTVRFAGTLYTRPQLARLAWDGMFFLPDRDVLSPSFTLSRQLGAASAGAAGAPVNEVAKTLGVEPLLDRRPPCFSSGERRRAELALALVRAPRCLIADEPLRGIDPRDVELIGVSLRALADGGCAVVTTGHEVTDLWTMADEVCWVSSGTSYSLGTPDQAMANERFRREYLTGSWG
jgi:ABC-type multidrug transport system ATPase subunit